MRRSRVFIQSSLLISLCAFGTPGYAAEKNANSKRKVAFAPVSVRMPPAAVTTAVPRAASPVEKSKLLNSSYPQSHLQRGYYFKQQGRIDDALLEFIRAAQENPREVRAFREQAEIFKERGNLKLAKSALEQSLAVTPGDSESRSFLVQLQFQSGNLVGAASEVGKLFGINQEKPKVAETKVKAPEVKVKLADSKPRAAESKTRSSDTKSSFYISPPAPGSQNSNVGGVNANAEESSEWLNSAASIVDTSPAVQSAGNFDEVASRLGIANANENKKLEAAAAAKAEAEARARNGGEAPTLASILGGIPAIGTSPAEPAAKPANADAKAPAERSSAENTSAAQSGIFSRVRSSASHAMVMPAWVRNHMPLGKDDASDAAPAAAAAGNKVEKMSKSASVLSWVKDKVPFTQEKQESASVPGDDKQGRMAAAISWMKEKTPFTGHEKAHDDFSNDPGRLASIVKGVRQKLPFVPKPFVMPTPGPVKPPPMVALGREIKQHIPFVKHNADEAAAPPAAPPKQTVTISGSDPNSELPATVSKMLEGKFNGAASVTTAPTPPSLPASTPMSDELKQVLASVSGPSSEGNPYERPDSVKGKYSLLKGNAFNHVGAMGIPQVPDVEHEPSMLDNIMKQARKTFASLVPSINFSWPNLSVLPGLQPAPGPGAVVASVPAPGLPEASSNAAEAPPPVASDTQAPAAGASTAAVAVAEQAAKTEAEGPKAPAPVPLDISRILSRMTAPAAPSAPPPIVPGISSLVPLAAAAPVNIDALINRPATLSAAPAPAIAAIPSMVPQGLNSSAAEVGPKTSPQASSQQPLPSQNALPPVVQEVLNRAQPVFKPAFDAANAFAQTFMPPTPVTNGEASASPVPVPQMTGGAAVPNKVPTPIAVDMQKYIQNMMVPTQSSESTEPELAAPPMAVATRRLIDVQNNKSGAFTYMKPVFDSDRNYLLGGKQVRQIQPLPGKAQQPKMAEPEDAITKRMRYLMEHGTSNLRRGEAFMFSEETGEGILFMPDGSSERRKLQDGRDHTKLMRERRPDIIAPRDLQYSLSILGKLLPPQQDNNAQNGQPLNGPTLDQLMQQMNQGSKGFFGWLKKGWNKQ